MMKKIFFAVFFLFIKICSKLRAFVDGGENEMFSIRKGFLHKWGNYEGGH
jgi:hypothetical protein